MPITIASAGGLAPVDYAVIAVYLGLMMLMGLSIAFRQRSTEDFFLAGRRLPSWAVGISLIASLLSTITYLGMPGEMFRTGVAFLTRQLGLPIILLVVWFAWIPFFMRLKLTSAYEFLERRYSYPVRVLGAVFCLLLLFGWISVVVLTASKAMSEITRLDLEWFFGTNGNGYRDADMHAIIVSIGLFSVIYTTLGGIRAVVWTDVIQFVVLLGGALFTMAAVAHLTGSGLTDWISTSRAYKHEQVEWFDPDIRTRSTIFSISIGMMFWTICTHGSNQVALQRYFTVRDVWAARQSFFYSALASMGLGFILAGVGIALMHLIQHQIEQEGREAATSQIEAIAGLDSEEIKVRNESQDAIFPQFIRSGYFPDGLRGLVVAALFAAAMSTIDSGANSVSTIVTVDFFRRFSPDRTAQSELRLARVLTASMGVVVVAGTVFLYHLSKGTDLITLCQKGFNCFLGPLGAVFFQAMFSRRSTSWSIIPAMLIGEAVGVCASYSPELFGVEFSTHLVVPTSWLATVIADEFISVWLVIAGVGPSPEQQRWLWWKVARKQD